MLCLWLVKKLRLFLKLWKITCKITCKKPRVWPRFRVKINRIELQRANYMQIPSRQGDSSLKGPFCWPTWRAEVAVRLELGDRNSFRNFSPAYLRQIVNFSAFIRNPPPPPLKTVFSPLSLLKWRTKATLFESARAAAAAVSYHNTEPSCQPSGAVTATAAAAAAFTRR